MDRKHASLQQWPNINCTWGTQLETAEGVEKLEAQMYSFMLTSANPLYIGGHLCNFNGYL